MSGYLEHITSVEDMKDKINDFALDMYNQGRADAEREFQNSDYWNDYLAKVIADAKAEVIEEFAEFFHRDYVYDCICRDDCPKHMLIGIVDKFAERLKEQK